MTQELSDTLPEAKQAAEQNPDELLYSLNDLNAATAKLREELELAWGIIANASGGDWSKESQEWQDAAARWRDRVMPQLVANQQPSAKVWIGSACAYCGENEGNHRPSCNRPQTNGRGG